MPTLHQTVDISHGYAVGLLTVMFSAICLYIASRVRNKTSNYELLIALCFISLIDTLI